MKWLYVISAFVALSLGSYIDNMRGPLLPLLSQQLDLPYSKASWFFTMGNLASIAGLFVLIRWVKGVSDRALAVFFSLLALAAVVALYGIHNFPTFVLTAVIWGACVAFLGALSNLLMIHGTNPERRGRLLCGLHMMYGLSSFTAPLVIGETIKRGLPFESAALWVIPMALWLGISSVRLTEKTPHPPPEASKNLSAGQFWILFLFASYVAGEVLISNWMVTFLVDFRGIGVPEASAHLSFFFLAMGISRGICFLSLPPRLEGGLLRFSLIAGLLGIVIGRFFWTPALAFAGLLGPFFPLLMARTSRAYPEQSRSLMLWIVGSVQVGLMSSQWVVGHVADSFGIQWAYLSPLFFLTLCLITLRSIPSSPHSYRT